jgi:predicted O-linked N-acetylglucosamine transferase (SPINDLY family)
LALSKLLGLAELAARTPGEYAEVAVRLASDLPALANLRRGLRARTAASPLCGGPRVARPLEGAYRRMWSSRP